LKQRLELKFSIFCITFVLLNALDSCSAWLPIELNLETL